jgi:hypothetical protein
MEKFGAVTKGLNELRSKVETLSAQDHSGSQEEIRKARFRLDELLYREEMMWLQRSYIAWLREGDRNTSFFHKKAAGRAKKNKMKHLRKSDGQLTKEKKEMDSMTWEFFQDLYKADPEVCPHELLDLVEPSITDDMNLELYKEFSDEKICNALFHIGPLKALGPDGFPARFSKRIGVQ